MEKLIQAVLWSLLGLVLLVHAGALHSEARKEAADIKTRYYHQAKAYAWTAISCACFWSVLWEVYRYFMHATENIALLQISPDQAKTYGWGILITGFLLIAIAIICLILSVRSYRKSKGGFSL